MSSIYNQLFNPLDPVKLETLLRLHAVVGAFPVVLVGAFARDLVFYHLYGIEVPRATMDMDISVQLASWEDFERMGRLLRASGFRNENALHPERFVDSNGQIVDLLPFGDLSEDGKTIIWPIDKSPWTISGLQDAYEHALFFELEGRRFRVVSPCAMICLKIFSCFDRPDDRKKKDIADIHFILENYLAVTGRERLKSGGADADAMELEKGNLQRVVARIAGRDIATLLRPETREALLKILFHETTSASRCFIAHELARYYRGDFQMARTILKRLQAGIEEST